MRVEGLAAYLQSEGVGTVAKDIFVNYIPDNLELAIMLNAGLVRDMIDYELPGYHKTVFQVAVRARKYADGYAVMQNVMNVLTLYNQEIGGVWYNYIRPQHDPVNYPISPGNLIEFSVHFSVSLVTPASGETRV